MRRLGVVLLVALVAIGCSDDDVADPEIQQPDPVATTTTSGLSPEEAEALLSFRPVLRAPRPSEECRPYETQGSIAAEPTCFELGPVALDARAVESAEAAIDPGSGQWVVAPTLHAGDDGIGRFNEIAGSCYQAGPSCPTRQVAIVVGGRVVAAPGIEAPSYERDAVLINGDFSQAEAEELAAALSA